MSKAIITSLFILFSSTLAMAQTETEVALKAEIKRLRHENNELAVQVGDLQMENESLKYQVSQKPPVLIEEEEILVAVPVYKKNRLSLLNGVGNNDSKLNSEYVTGLQYQRSLNDKLSFGAQMLTNKTTLFSLGVDF